MPSPLKNPNFSRSQLRSSLKKPSEEPTETEEELSGSSARSRSPPVSWRSYRPSPAPPPASPPIHHFPALSFFPKSDGGEEEEEEEDSDAASTNSSKLIRGGSIAASDEGTEEGGSRDEPEPPLGFKIGNLEGSYQRRAKPKEDKENGEVEPEASPAEEKGEQEKTAQVAVSTSEPEGLLAGGEGCLAPQKKKGGLKKSVQRQAVKNYKIYKAPEVLTVHLKRFQQDLRGRLQKINGRIPFDLELDLTAFCDQEGPEKDGVRYELVAIVEHSGTLRGGHYVAYVRRTAQVLHAVDDDRYPSKWYYVSDSHSRQVELSEMEQCEAYMLLYVRLP